MRAAERNRPWPAAPRLWRIGAVVLMACLAMPAASHAQQAPAQPAQQGVLGGAFSGNSGEPIQVDADTLEVRDKEKKAIFRGNVIVVQGDMTLRTVELWVDYAGEIGAGATQAADSDQSSQRIRRLEAKGKVHVVTSDQETTGDWAIYEVQDEKVTIGGNVVVTQGTNVIQGTKLIVDLRTNHTHFESPQRGGRVQAIFTPKSKEQQGEGAER